MNSTSAPISRIAPTAPRVRVGPEDFSLDEMAKALRPAGGGCIVSFLGTVRADSDHGTVAYLDFESYRPMAEAKMGELVARAKVRFPTMRDAALTHRTGRLEVGENIVAVAVSADHREEGFAAARWLIDRLKEEVPIWKKEVTSLEGTWKEVRYPHP